MAALDGYTEDAWPLAYCPGWPFEHTDPGCLCDVDLRLVSEEEPYGIPN